MSAATPEKRGRGQHGVQPLSVATRRRMLAAMMARADAGDLDAAEVLVRLSLEVERVRRSPVSSLLTAAGYMPAEPG